MSAFLETNHSEFLIINCTKPELEAWTKLIEFRPEMMNDQKVVWRSKDAGNLETILPNLFKALIKSSLTSLTIQIDLTTPMDNSSCDVTEELRYFCQLIPQLAEKLTHLDISVEGSAVLFPVVDNVTKFALSASNLESLSLNMDLGSSSLSMITSALVTLPSLKSLTLKQVSAGTVNVKSSPGFGSDLHETDQYVYEEEGTTVSEQEFENISESVSEIFAKALGVSLEVSMNSAGFPGFALGGGFYPLPTCSGGTSGVHYLSEYLNERRCGLNSLSLNLTTLNEVLCLSGSLLRNHSLKTLMLNSSEFLESEDTYISFPLLMAISTNVGLSELDLSGMKLSMSSDEVSLALYALSSNTALRFINLYLTSF
ncbi:uncharacterized protein LOC111697866 [Eurytemora carolleeae]|uniref:uncharacterized protein LOC111697866 n=1 Tax=Eurytemora carolleeae TaxID=1294199 RepID=UPI000C782D02|nr:uncharacterized protein LOC111697866 [Eurytemora carolleeae]|eukprot:XP_023323770.1 uncharacterized protein LOC111697866 [Eurytemora affinis]